MNCIVCGSSYTAHQKKCSKCGAELLISKADFLFEFDETDTNVVKKHYETYKKTQETVVVEERKNTEKKAISVDVKMPDFKNLTNVQYRQLQASSDPAKQYELGCLYFKGCRNMVEKNASKAFSLFYKSAKQGNVDAQYMLAYCYENGYGTQIIEKQALKWYRKAFENGKTEAADSIRRLGGTVQEQGQNFVSGSISSSNSNLAQYSVQNTTTESAETYEIRPSRYSDELYEETPYNSRTVYNPPLRPVRTVGQRIRDFFRNIVNFFRVICAIISSVVLGVGLSLILLICVNYVIEKDIGNIIFSAILLAIAIPLLIWLYGKEFERLEDRGILYRWLSRELVITPIVLVIILVGGMLCFRFIPALKYKVGEFQLNQGSYSAARTTFEELGDYNDSIHIANTIIEQFPSVLREGDIVKFGTYEQDNNYENGKENIEWQVVYGSSYDGYASYVTLISKNALDYRHFDANYWEYSSLRNWLNNDFLNAAFTPEEQAVLDFTGGYNTDKVDVFAIGNKAYFPIEILHTTPSEYARSKGSADTNWCFRWTNQNLTFEVNTIQASYVDSNGAILGDVPNGYFYIRPVIRLKIFAYENQLANGDNHYTELYNSDLSGLLKTYTGTYVAGQGITCMDFTITSCDKYGNITAEVFFYPHPSNPSVPSGRYMTKGCITTIDKKDDSFSINLVGDKWISRPDDYEMLELSVTVDSQFSSITGGYQFDLKSIE